MSPANVSEILQLSEAVAIKSRKKAVEMTSMAKTSHIGSCLSVIDILAILFALKHSSKEHSQDQIVLSKGHAAAALYAVLDSFGLLESKIEEFCKDNSKIYGHINHLASNQIPLSTGSLGHGLPFGVGMALANKLRKEESRTFIVISDGELNEGTTWESALLAGHHKLSNLAVFIDRNQIQSLGFTEDILKLNPIKTKWESFGWEVLEVNGHNYQELLDSVLLETSKPLCIIANTIKGKGVDFMEGTLEWHYKSADEKQMADAVSQIKRGLL